MDAPKIDDRLLRGDPAEAAAFTLDSGPQAETQPLEGIAAEYRCQSRTLADALEPSPRVPQIVQGILPARSLTCFYGAPGTLKTSLLLDMAMAIATGNPWLPGAPGASVSVPYGVSRQPVVWVDVDSGHDVLKERIAAFARAYGAPGDTPFYWFTFPSPPIQAAKGLTDLAAYAKSVGAGLIVFDNLLRIPGVPDENSSQMDAAMSALRQLTIDTGAAVNIIHHRRKQTAGRPGDTMRGHSSIEAAIDAALLMERAGLGDVVTVKCTKARRKPIADFAARWTFELEEDNETLHTARFFHSDEVTSYEGVKARATTAMHERIVSVLKDEGPLNQREIAAKVGGRKQSILEVLADLGDEGILTLEDGPRGSTIYSVTDG